MVAEVRPVVGALSTSATIALPSVWAQDDILVIHAETEDVAHAPPSGWGQVTGSPLSQTNAPATRHHLWWKRAGSSESNVSHSITGLDHRISYMYAVKGCPTTGDPWDVTATALDNTTDTSGDCPGLTTTEVNTCITCHMTTGFDRATNSSTWHSGWTNTSLQAASAMVPVNALTERRDNTNNTGSGGTVGMATGFKPAAGTVDTTPVTVVDATTKAMMTVAWKSSVTAIDPTLAEARTENASPFTTQIIAAKAAAKLVMSVLVSGTAVATPTITGLGLTWTTIGSPITIGDTTSKLCWYESTQVGGSDVSGQITITVGTTPTGCSWSIYQLTGMAASGTIVQSPSTVSGGLVSTLTITFAAAANAANRPVVAFGVIPQNTGGTITPEAGWVEGAEVVRSTPAAKLWTAYQPTTFDTSTAITEDSTYDIGAIGLEINFVSGTTVAQTSTAPAATNTATATAAATATQASTAPAGQATVSVTSSAAGQVASTAPAAAVAFSGASTVPGMAQVAPAAAVVSGAVQAAGTAASTATAAAATAVGVVGSSTGLASAATAPAGVVAGTVGTEDITATAASTAPAAQTAGAVASASTASAASTAPAGLVAGSVVIGIAVSPALTAPPATVVGTTGSVLTAAQASIPAPAVAGFVVASEGPVTVALTSSAPSAAVAGVVGVVDDLTVVSVAAAGIILNTAAASVTTAVVAAAPAAVVAASVVELSDVEATYTPGEPYMLTIPGPPYVESGVFGWGQGGWGEGPWGGT